MNRFRAIIFRTLALSAIILRLVITEKKRKKKKKKKKQEQELKSFEKQTGIQNIHNYVFIEVFKSLICCKTKFDK